MVSVPVADLDEILDQVVDLDRRLGACRILITGGTGFFGRWLLESWDHSSKRLNLRRTAVVVTRDPSAFATAFPHLAESESIELVRGDVLHESVIDGTFDACIHAATAASLALTESEPRSMFDTIVTGTSNVLDWLEPSGSIPTLFTSSGAVYGGGAGTAQLIPETDRTGPDPLDPGQVYGEAKRAAEMLCALRVASGARIRIARCFAFVGPHLPLDAHFAIGNFVADAVSGRRIVVRGDGSPVRSYMYPTDLVVWLRTILADGVDGRAYNVGSEEGRPLREIAEMVATRVGTTVEIRGGASHSSAANRYVPSIARAGSELGLSVRVDLDHAIERTIGWAGSAFSSR
ncbi:MAG: NAD(P)-dependent oxidoreductase [Acidimicrobiia bacterium]|nr:NAD(P)-dependent oxidoreductase [Acidimicrobiia bacterium]